MQKELILRILLLIPLMLTLLLPGASRISDDASAIQARSQTQRTASAAETQYIDAARPVYHVSWVSDGCTWNSEEGSWSYSYPGASCPTGWTVVTSWTSLAASGSSGGSCTAWRFTLCSA